MLRSVMAWTVLQRVAVTVRGVDAELLAFDARLPGKLHSLKRAASGGEFRGGHTIQGLDKAHKGVA